MQWNEMKLNIFTRGKNVLQCIRIPAIVFRPFMKFSEYMSSQQPRISLYIEQWRKNLQNK